MRSAERLLNRSERVPGLEAINLSESDECKRYIRERLSWQQIIIVDGVTDIPASTFFGCKNIEKVIFANTVIRIERRAFSGCSSLVSIKLPTNLEYIGAYAFKRCNLSSAFVPPTCREICRYAFTGNRNLSIFHVPQDTELDREGIIQNTALARASPIVPNRIGIYYTSLQKIEMNRWIKTMNNDEEFALHRACSSFQPLKEVILTIIQEKGLKAFKDKNSARISPSRYLEENPYTILTEKEIIQEYLSIMMGEVE
ncbi:hypothetical protein CTEN210_13170 [Chaetoceros tenuissimus]|uniref:Leucine-rich repeat domain-containing protein n=1 Tax=Chaetoceros tenuissimus TaxID=426638 RepID=A0AAD3D2U8_9STRA|nr:hypothetical protein CTEN210_13170 [Chaetoceros tenuissimus]